MLYKIVNSEAPEYLTSLNINLLTTMIYNLRHNNNLRLPFARTSTVYQSFFPQTVRDWNNLAPEVRIAPSYNQFRASIYKSENPTVHKLYIWLWTSSEMSLSSAP